MLQALRQWFAGRPDLKVPPIVAVMTHIDLLSPSLEWSPPYNWQQPSRPKEVQIHEALAALRDQLGSHLAGAVPLCTAEGRVYGIEEWFLPTLAELLGEARAVALLRRLRGGRRGQGHQGGAAIAHRGRAGFEALAAKLPEALKPPFSRP